MIGITGIGIQRTSEVSMWYEEAPSDGHGTWTHTGGQTYDQRFVSMINFATAPGPGPGFEAGWMKVQHTVTMIDADQIESAGTNSFYRLNGELYRTGCSTATGRRSE